MNDFLRAPPGPLVFIAQVKEERDGRREGRRGRKREGGGGREGRGMEGGWPCDGTLFIPSSPFGSSHTTCPDTDRTLMPLTWESEISEGFSVRLLLSAGMRSLYLVTSSSE